MRILFDSKNLIYKTPFGCIKPEEKCSLRIDIPSECKTEKLRLCIFDENGFEMLVPFKLIKKEGEYDLFKCTFSLFSVGLYFYYFRVETEQSNFSLFKQENGTNIEEGDFWQITCYENDGTAFNEYSGSVMYQIFPDRFYKKGTPDLTDKLEPYTVHESTEDIPVWQEDSEGKILNNDFFGGNLRGITEKLPYIKELGVGIIYLNPIFKAFSNHRYDTADYKKIDPMLGTEEDFANLCDTAHAMGIKIILDGAFSHTGSNSIYFDKNGIFGNGAFHNENSPYRKWYDFKENSEYTSWWGIDTLPCVNETEPSYMDYIINSEDSVAAHWMRLGADGFRLDVADELPDEFIAALKRRMREINPKSLLLGEVWEDASNKISYSVRRKYFLGEELDSVMNYPFRDAVIAYAKGENSAEEFSGKIMSIVENYPKEILSTTMNMLSSHDTPRILTLLGKSTEGMSKEEKSRCALAEDELEQALLRLKLAVFLQFTLPGMPCIYYGDEIGMQGFEDPFCRKYFEWNNAGCELKKFFCTLGRLKNENMPLKKGDISFISTDETGLVFERCFGNEKVIVSVTGTEAVGDFLYKEKIGNKIISLRKVIL